MNERINLLKHQASIWCHENIPEQFSEETNGYGSAWEDKFAELIVRECARVAKIIEPEAGDDYASGRTWAGIDVLKHFGVEE